MVHQQFVAPVRTTSVSRAVMSVEKDLQAAEPATTLKSLLARASATKAEEDVHRPSSYYSWQCLSHDHQPHMFHHHCTDSPLPCTETGNPPDINTATASS